MQHPLEAMNNGWWHLLHAVRGTVDPADPGRWNPIVIRAFYTGVHHILETYFRGYATKLANIPDGRALFVGMHGGGLMSPDLVLAGAAFYRHTNFQRPMYGLAHRMLFSIPAWNQLLMAIGAIEGTRENAIRLLRDEHAVIVFPGGEYDMSRTFRHRNDVRFAGRTGFVKVALEADAPIVPVGAVGGHGIYITLTEGRMAAKVMHLKKWFDVSTFPLCLSLPWGVSVSWFPCIPLPSRLGVAFGPPLHFKPSLREKNDPAYHAYVRDTVEAAVKTEVGELLEGMGHPGKGFHPWH